MAMLNSQRVYDLYDYFLARYDIFYFLTCIHFMAWPKINSPTQLNQKHVDLSESSILPKPILCVIIFLIEITKHGGYPRVQTHPNIVNHIG